jgi:hypothetical protein
VPDDLKRFTQAMHQATLREIGGRKAPHNETPVLKQKKTDTTLGLPWMLVSMTETTYNSLGKTLS